MFVLKREVGGMVEYLTIKQDYAIGAGYAFVNDSGLALGFARFEDADDYMRANRLSVDHRISVVQVK